MLVRKVRRVRLHSGWFFIMQKLRTAGNVGKIGNNVISQLLMNLSTGGGWGGNSGKKCKTGKIAICLIFIKQKIRRAGNVGKKGKKVIFELHSY